MAGVIVLKTEGKDAPAPELGEESGDKVIAGPIRTSTWNHWTGENDRLFCGIWESNPGKVRIDYAEWEFCHFLAGKAVLTNEAGEKAGRCAPATPSSFRRASRAPGRRSSPCASTTSFSCPEISSKRSARMWIS
jgi:uncharacterized cupin superfamily protein